MSDHISGPRALAEPVADITDFYAFPSPDRPDCLVLVQNTLPFAPAGATMSEGLIYRFRIRPATIDSATDERITFEDEELTIDCQFDPPRRDDDGRFVGQTGKCSVPGLDPVSFELNAIGDQSGVRVFAGPRWDPFFMDAPSALKTIANEALSFSSHGSIYMDGKSVLTLVVEIHRDLLPFDHPYIAVITETVTNGFFPVRMEHVGRPELKNMMLAPKQFDQINKDLEIRDLYNMEDVFNWSEAYQGAYRARLNANLSFWDGLDGTVDSPLAADGSHPLTEIMLKDVLLLDLSKPYAESGSFFEIEQSLLTNKPNQTCGGRALNDDVMDTIFTTLVNGGHGQRISDGVDQATRPASTTFPYLAAPHENPPEAPPHH